MLKFRIYACGLMVFISIAPKSLHATEIDTGIPDLDIRFDNTVKYTALFRLAQPDAALINNPPFTNGFDDGDRNFKRGLASNRVDLLSEFEMTYGDFGLRVSGAAWYDSIYREANHNNSPATSNNISVPYNDFTGETAKVMGKDVELLDAFVSSRGHLGDMPLDIRVGRLAQQWGESIFFGNNAVAGGMAPVDIVKLQSVPNATFRETIRPTGQFSANLAINPNFSIGAFWQWEWEASRLPPAGSYFATSDNLPIGGESLWIAQIGPIPHLLSAPTVFLAQRTADAQPGSFGQAGLQAKFRVPGWGPEFGLYALVYDGKTPADTISSVSVNPVTNPVIGTNLRQAGVYKWVYGDQIRLYGASANESFGDVNVGFELSARQNTPLASFPQSATGAAYASANGSNHVLYAVGDTIHANLSALWDIGRNPLSEEASFVGEIAANGRLATTKNPQALDPETNRYAVGTRMVVTFTYREVLPGLDVGVPLGIGYYPAGRSSAIAPFGPAHGGDASMGLKGTYNDVWNYALNYTRYIGNPAPYLNGIPGQNYQTFGQPLADRDFLSLSLSRTF